MVVFEEKDFLACCGSSTFAKEMVLAGPFSDYILAVDWARDIWFNKVDVNGWLEAFGAHPKIGESPKSSNPSSANWSKGEQSRALATATESTLKELVEWNATYSQKFGFVFLICASGRSTPEILAELKRRYTNRPIVEFENAAQEQMKITELRLAKLFSADSEVSFMAKKKEFTTDMATKAGEDRVSVISAHITTTEPKPSETPTRTRPPITTHVLDTARGSPAAGIEVKLEALESKQPETVFSEPQHDGGDHWILLGSSVTDKDGRSGQLITNTAALKPGIYRISFSTGKYYPDGFFPYVSIVFNVKESQKFEHFHVPLLLSPFSFSTYRGS